MKEELSDENKELKLKCGYLEEALDQMRTKHDLKVKDLESRSFDIEQVLSDKIKDLEDTIEKTKKKHSEDIKKMIDSFEKQIEEIMTKSKESKDKLLKINYEKDEEIVRLISKSKSTEE